MASLNRVMLIGNITRDPSSKQLPGGTSVCEFGLAMNRRFKTSAGEEREEVLFVDCSAWGKQGEVDPAVLHEGQAAVHRGPAETRHLGRQAGRREAQQDQRRRGELPIPRRARRRWR
jgi:single stranded DNA-binding protein